MKRTGLLSRLWEFQNNYGYISENAITEIAQELNVSKIEIEGVISFYHFFHRQPTGKYIIYLNNSIISEFKDLRLKKELSYSIEYNKLDFIKVMNLMKFIRFIRFIRLLVHGF